MKLLCCEICGEIFNLGHSFKECSGSHCGGNYINNIDAKVFITDRTQQFVLGFATGSFEGALRQQIILGDSNSRMPYAGGMVAKGRDFTAFIIPESAESVIRVKTKAELNI